MSSLTRVWLAAGVAVVNGHTDQGCKLKSLVKSIRQGKKAFTSSTATDPLDVRPFSRFLGSKVHGNDKTQSDDSFRNPVVYAHIGDRKGMNKAVEGARIVGASRIIWVDLNADRFEFEFVNPKDYQNKK